MTFEEMCLDTRIMRAIAEMGFEQPSPIQAQSIPIAVEGKDMIGQARTGTGKTASFGIPMLQRINPKDKNLQAIVLCPTRELAIQSANEIRKLAKFLHGIKVLPIYGGQEISKQIRSLKGGVQIVIGTPGRVMDHLRRHTLKPQTVDIVVLDEADEMLNMGFREDIETILGQLPEERQTMLFSATMPKPILEIAKRYLHEPEIVKVIQKELTVPKIEQYYYEVNPRKKNEVLSRLLDMYDPSLSLVFCNTKRKVDELVADLKGRGYFAEGLHGDMKQSQRDRVMNGFRNGRTDILVATDVAARGIDVDDVEAVFNYDVPQDDEYYVHRIGRTGRAGREGRAFTLVVGKEIYKLKDIQRYCKTKIRRQPIPSVNDVAAIKVEKLLEQAGELIATDGLGRMMDLLEEYLDGSDYSATEMAAALLAMQLGETSTQTLPKEEFGDTGAEPGMVRMFMNIGKKDRVRIGDILGAVAGESGMEGALVGTIDMYDNFSFVEVPQEYAAAVLEAMNHSKIKGRRVNMEPAKNVRN
ncbi:MAG: DEAD/DEAH box helicase [Clostridium sp.]|jgi:ATP-dependent RNA helicase DeaD|uniref:DEAD/DEAH box helicase n=1 Tax=Butyribacter sp. TaxID=2822465 RepID=UPI0026A16244|nr:DEAD/DEAH box helicase [Clostridium sp.]MEE0030156.1 DEAD/DEAH box helicase [Lachnospiraceae bacterium]